MGLLNTEYIAFYNILLDFTLAKSNDRLSPRTKRSQRTAVHYLNRARATFPKTELVPVDFIPFHTLRKGNAAPAENIERTTDREIDLTATACLDAIQVGEASPAAGIGHWNRAPFSQPRDEFLVDSTLQALDIGGVDQEFGAVRLEHFDSL
ncbi:hypothetical protein LOZ60_006047 [Ophidiomyces ophidiicola]|nr:hypothetical protein LOZ60_006047 [Ophidiomyces ophidiicola]